MQNLFEGDKFNIPKEILFDSENLRYIKAIKEVHSALDTIYNTYKMSKDVRMEYVFDNINDIKIWLKTIFPDFFHLKKTETKKES